MFLNSFSNELATTLHQQSYLQHFSRLTYSNQCVFTHKFSTITSKLTRQFHNNIPQFNTSKWLMQPFSSFIAWSRSCLILWKRLFNNFAETGSPDLPSRMRSLIVWMCGLLEREKACRQWYTNHKESMVWRQFQVIAVI